MRLAIPGVLEMTRSLVTYQAIFPLHTLCKTTVTNTSDKLNRGPRRAGPEGQGHFPPAKRSVQQGTTKPLGFSAAGDAARNPNAAPPVRPTLNEERGFLTSS